MPGILKFQICHSKVRPMSCFIKLEISEFWRICLLQKMDKFSDMPTLKHILTDPTLGFCFVLFLFLFFVLFCFVLFCFVLFCFVLFCFVFCFVLFCVCVFCFCF